MQQQQHQPPSDHCDGGRINNNIIKNYNRDPHSQDPLAEEFSLVDSGGPQPQPQPQPQPAQQEQQQQAMGTATAQAGAVLYTHTPQVLSHQNYIKDAAYQLPLDSLYFDEAHIERCHPKSNTRSGDANDGNCDDYEPYDLQKVTTDAMLLDQESTLLMASSERETEGGVEDGDTLKVSDDPDESECIELLLDNSFLNECIENDYSHFRSSTAHEDLGTTALPAERQAQHYQSSSSGKEQELHQQRINQQQQQQQILQGHLRQLSQQQQQLQLLQSCFMQHQHQQQQQQQQQLLQQEQQEHQQHQQQQQQLQYLLNHYRQHNETPRNHQLHNTSSLMSMMQSELQALQQAFYSSDACGINANFIAGQDQNNITFAPPQKDQSDNAVVLPIPPNHSMAPSLSPIITTNAFAPASGLVSNYQVTSSTINANHNHLDSVVPLKPNKPCHQQLPQPQRCQVIGPSGAQNITSKKRRTAQSTSKAHKSKTDDSSGSYNGDGTYLICLAQLKEKGCEQEEPQLPRKEGNNSQHPTPESSSTTVSGNSLHSNTGRSFNYVKAVGGGITKHDSKFLPQERQEDQSLRLSKGRQVSVCSHQLPPSRPSVTSGSPYKSIPPLHDYFNTLITSRHYRPKTIPAITLGYRPNPPTPLQLASFGFAVCSTIDRACSSGGGGAGASRLTALLRAGLSPNPTNKFGDSPFLVACKRGMYSLVNAFVEAGAEVRVADGFGRTPLHYAAWADPPCMDSVSLLLRADARLLLVSDLHGKKPLEYVGEQHRVRWMEFLDGIKDEMWPMQQDGTCVEYFPLARWTKPDAVVGSSGNNDVPDPKDALSLELAEKVASGHIMPQEARRQQHERQRHQLLLLQQDGNATDSNIEETT